MAKVTEHFDSKEFDCRDGTPYPAEWITPRLLPLCKVLEVIRAHVNAPIAITSGYRTPAYNKKVGGARASQHMLGIAADIKVKGWSASRVHDLILKLYNENKLNMLGGLGSYPSFTHVDVRPSYRLVRWSGSRKNN